MTIDTGALPPALAASIGDCLARGRRFYVAWAPGHPRAVLRHKDADGRATWEARPWTLFDGAAPTIVDVTDAVPGLWRALLEADGADYGVYFRPATSALEVVKGPAPSDGIDLMDQVNFAELAGLADDPGATREASRRRQFWAALRLHIAGERRPWA